jgi:anhydro-N-acetylmuramic acid kinase
MAVRRDLYAGVMSGTSLDGVDAVIAEFPASPGKAFALLGVTHITFPSALRDELLALQAAGNDEIARAARAANALADLYAKAITDACDACGVAPHDLVAAGVHGQTVRHRPEQGWTLQINNPARVAERAYVTVVADFASRDVAAGGQGAPLVPAFHAATFGDPEIHRVIVNIGGIANVTDLPSRGTVSGFDTGPGNVLMDSWSARHRGTPFDANGAWAAQGRVAPALLTALLEETYFAAPPPKSTGRDLFNAAWLDALLSSTIGAAGMKMCRRRWQHSRPERSPMRCVSTLPARPSCWFVAAARITRRCCACWRWSSSRALSRPPMNVASRSNMSRRSRSRGSRAKRSRAGRATCRR